MTIVYGEIIGEVLRGHRRNDAKPGEPFDFIVVAVGDEGTATLKGLRMPADDTVTAADWDAIRRHLRRRGYRRVIWRRRDRKTGEEKRVVAADLA